MKRTILPIVVLSLYLSVSPSAEAQDKTLAQTLAGEGAASLAKAASESGDPKRGAVVFHRRRSTCTNCHSAGDGPAACEDSGR